MVHWIIFFVRSIALSTSPASANGWRRSTAPLARPSVDPEMMIRMLLVGYCFGIQSERRLCEDVHLNLACRWFCRLDLNDPVSGHSTFSSLWELGPQQPALPFSRERYLSSHLRSHRAALHSRGSGRWGAFRRRCQFGRGGCQRSPRNRTRGPHLRPSKRGESIFAQAGRRWRRGGKMIRGRWPARC